MKDTTRRALRLLEIVLLVGALIFLGLFVYKTVSDHRQLSLEQQMRDEIHSQSDHATATDAAVDLEAVSVETLMGNQQPTEAPDTGTEND